MELTKKQNEAVNIVLSKARNGEKFAVISGYAGSGKAQPNDTVIPTPDGYKTIGELKIGDYVFDRKGQPTKVIGVYPQGKLDNYEVTLGDGRKTYCNDEHIWTYYTSKGNFCNKTLREILDAGLKYNGRGCYKFKIPVVEQPVEYKEKKVDIDPYVLGCFLGDGCCKERQLTFSSSDEEIVNKISTLIGAKGYRKNSGKNYNWTFLLKEPRIISGNNINIAFLTKAFFSKYSEYLCCGAEDKRIPPEYKYNSVENRLKLLQGLFDTDGSICTTSGFRYNVRYTSININLIKDIQEVLYSLGYSSTITKDLRTKKYTTTGVCYSLDVNIANEEKYKLFRVTRKKNIALEAQKYHKRRCYDKIAIIKVTKMTEQKEMTCIMVDNKEHLYLTNDFIVTHNTTVVNYIIEALINEGLCQLNDIGYACFTGKAAQVLIDKGHKNAMTLHKLLYDTRPTRDGKFFRTPKVSLDKKVIVVDECSMAPNEIVKLLLSYPVFVIFLGDPGQLPPIREQDNNHLLDRPDVFLDEIMRQAQDSGIIQLSMKIRNKESIHNFHSSDALVLPQSEFVDGCLSWADIVLTATNKTRVAMNSQIREMLGMSDEVSEGDKLICLRNYWDDFSINANALTNGCIGTLRNLSFEENVISPRSGFKKGTLPVVKGSFTTETGDLFPKEFSIDKNCILTGSPTLDNKMKYLINTRKGIYGEVPYEFTYGYAITTHKAQGSQWGNVLVLEESFPFSTEEHARWLYTAVTRAVNTVVVIEK